MYTYYSTIFLLAETQRDRVYLHLHTFDIDDGILLQ